jgi:phosphoglycolate phosphatase
MLLVFDLDGTLVDSMRDLAESASEMTQAFGGTPLDTAAVAAMIGDGAAALVQRAIQASGATVAQDAGLARFLEIYDTRLLRHTRPYAGIPEALAALATTHRLAVLTNKPAAASQTILDGLDLAPRFDRVIGGDGPFPRKPDPAGLRALMADRPGEPTVLVGDSPVDEQAARAAGCTFVLARYGFGWTRYGAIPATTPFVLEEPSDLRAVIERVQQTPSRA